MKNKWLVFVVMFVVLASVLSCTSSTITTAGPDDQTQVQQVQPIGTIQPTQPIGTIQPTPTHVVIKTDAYSFLAKYYNMTDPQRHQFELEHKGQWVDWTYKVYNVVSFLGLTHVEIEIPVGYSNISINLYDAPETVMTTLNRGQTIHFTGYIDSISWIVDSPSIMISGTQILK